MATKRSNPRHEPDEPGENTLTRWSKNGGLEVRIREDANDPPLAQDIAKAEDEAFKAPKSQAKPKPRA